MNLLKFGELLHHGVGVHSHWLGRISNVLTVHSGGAALDVLLWWELSSVHLSLGGSHLRHQIHFRHGGPCLSVCPSIALHLFHLLELRVSLSIEAWSHVGVHTTLSAHIHPTGASLHILEVLVHHGVHVLLTLEPATVEIVVPTILMIEFVEATAILVELVPLEFVIPSFVLVIAVVTLAATVSHAASGAHHHVQRTHHLLGELLHHLLHLTQHHGVWQHLQSWKISFTHIPKQNIASLVELSLSELFEFPSFFHCLSQFDVGVLSVIE